MHFESHSEPSFQECEILTISELHRFTDGVFMFKYDKGLLPHVFDNM